MPISQSNTKWFKKGSKLPDGTTAKRSLVWNTKSNKRVTGSVKMVVNTAKAKAGSKVKYNAGRTTVKNRPAAAGGGVKPGKPGIGPSKNPKANAGYKPTGPKAPVNPKVIKPKVDKNKNPKAKVTSKPVLWGKRQTPPSSRLGKPGDYQAGQNAVTSRSYTPPSPDNPHATASSVRANSKPIPQLERDLLNFQMVAAARRREAGRSAAAKAAAAKDNAKIKALQAAIAKAKSGR